MFKVDSTCFFLTYPQSDFVLEELYEFLNSLKPILWARLAKETHQSGEPHIHAVFKFTGRFQSRDVGVFDYKERHPNIQSARNPGACLQYCAKEGQYQDYGAVPTGTRKRARLELDRVFELAKGADKAEFNKEAMQAGLSFQWAKELWESEHKDKSRTIPVDYTADMSREHAQLHLLGPASSNQVVTVITGPTGCGKTSWAKRVCKKPGLFCRHLEDLKLFEVGYHQSIIFDDLTFSHLPRDTQLYLVDMNDPITLHVRHTVIRLPAGIERIFTNNHFPFTKLPEIERRIFRVKVVHNL